MRAIIAKYEPQLIDSFSKVFLESWLAGAAEIGSRLPPPTDREQYLFGPEPEEIRFPIRDAAIQNLARRNVITKQDWEFLTNEARQKAFTVANLANEDAIARVQEALVDDIGEGGTLRQFAQRLEKALGKSALGKAHVENIYRTNVGIAYSNGLTQILDRPLVSDEFPFVRYVAVHDSRVDPDHLSMEKRGIQGTAIYYKDDPVIRRFWPPWRFNCRCHVIPLSIEDAARYGIREAQEWLRTGIPPINRTYVEMPPFSPPEGWVR